MNDKNDIILSIYVPTYGHEKYISRALDSILMQKTSYKYEILVGEDASPDGTREILKKYEEKYPDKFRMFYREVNMHGKIPSNARDLQLHCTGKYIIGLEGDDFWTSDSKIEKQISFLENNPDYIAVAHNCVIVDDDDNITDEQYPECKDEEYTLKHLISEIMPGHLTTLMARNYVRGQLFDRSILDKGLMPGDQLVYFTLITHGRIFCIQEKMSAYRHIIKGGTSYSANYKYDFVKTERWHAGVMEYAKSLDTKMPLHYTQMMYLRNIFYALRRKDISFKEFMQYLKKIDHKVRAIWLFAKQYVNHRVFHKKIWV